MAAEPELEPIVLVAASWRPVKDRVVARQELDPAPTTSCSARATRPAAQSTRRSRTTSTASLDEELASALKELRGRARAAIRVEAVVFLDADPWQLASLARQLVAQPRVLLLAR